MAARTRVLESGTIYGVSGDFATSGTADLCSLNGIERSPMIAIGVVVVLVAMLLLLYKRNVHRNDEALATKWRAYGSGRYDLLLTVEHDSPWCLYFRGRGLFEAGMFEEAAECFRQADLRDYSNDKKALYREALGDLRVELGQIDEALECFASGAEQSPGRGGCHRGMAVALLRVGRRGALPWARKALPLDEGREGGRVSSHDIEIHDVRAWNVVLSLAVLAWAVAAETGDSAEVEQILARLMDLAPERVIPVGAQAFYHAGRAYAALGQEAKSVVAFAKAAELDPKGQHGRLARAEGGEIRLSV